MFQILDEHGAELSASIAEEGLYSLEAPVPRVTGWDTVEPLRRSEGFSVPTTQRIAAAVRATLEG